MSITVADKYTTFNTCPHHTHLLRKFKMRYNMSFFILFICCLSSLCYAGDIAIEDLIRGINQSRLTIQSGEVQTETIEEKAARKTEEEIAKYIQENKEKDLKQYSPYLGVDAKTYEKDYVIPKLNYLANKYRQHTVELHTTTLFQIVNPNTVGFPKLYQYKLILESSPGISLDSELAQNLNAGITYFLAYDTQSQVKLDIGNIITTKSLPGAVKIYDSDEFYGYAHNSLWGRSFTRVPIDAKHFGKESIDGNQCHVITYTNEYKQKVKIWVDESIDFCLRQFESLRDWETEQISYRMKYKNYRKFNDVWYPTSIEETSYMDDGTKNSNKKIKVTSALFNVDFPKDFFKNDKSIYRPAGIGVLPGFGTPQLSTSSPEEETLHLLCGPQSLLRICELLKVDSNIQELKKLSNYDPLRGTTMKGLKEAAIYKGLSPIGVRTSLELLKRGKVSLPAIAYVDDNHFIVFESVDKNGVKISDPAKKYDSHITWDKVSEIWDGQLLIVDKKKLVKQKLVPLAFTDAPIFDFGKVLGGNKIKHTFTIKNIGQKPLKILSVTETCACTATILTQNEILPGKTGKVSSVLQVDSGNYLVQENIFVHTDDPVQNTLKLTLKGEAYLPLKTFPERFAIGTHNPLQKPLDKKISLHMQEGVKIINVRTDSKHMKATLLYKDRDIPMINLQLMQSLPVGKYNQRLLVDYSYKGKKATHDVYIYGEIVGDLHVTPNRLFFGLVKDKPSFLKTITITSRKMQPFEITAAASSTKTVKVAVTKEENKTRYQLTTTISPEAKSGEVSGEVVIQTSSEVQPTVRVPFFGIIANANSK